MQAVKLFLDDERTPAQDGWNIARSLPEFISFINRVGIPDEISFDHDLSEAWYPVQFSGVSDAREMPDTGLSCAHWLIEHYCHLPKPRPPFPETSVHSMNPVGKANIEGLIASCKRGLEAGLI